MKSSQRHSRQAGQLYVLLFMNGLVKVGRASSARDRLPQHRAEGARHGNPVVSEWVSVRLTGGLEFAEEALIAACRLPGVTWWGHEWFTGLSFEEAVQAAEHVVNDRITEVVRFEGGKLVLGRVSDPPPAPQPRRHLANAAPPKRRPPLPTARSRAVAGATS